jgi:hypothetical protein
MVDMVEAAVSAFGFRLETLALAAVLVVLKFPISFVFSKGFNP